MPFGNGTGPLGQGPLTGRGLGPCAGYPNQGFTGRGFGRGFGRGRGVRFRQFGRTPIQPIYQEPIAQPITLTKVEEKKILEAELKAIETEKKEITKRLNELK